MIKKLILIFAFMAFLLMSQNFAHALPEPGITVYPNSLSSNSSFVMVVDPMTTKAPIRIAWAVFNPNMDGNYLIGHFPMVGGKGICYFSNDDKESTCGPSPFMGTGRMLIDVFATAADGDVFDYGNSSKEVALGTIKLNGGPVYDPERNLVLLTYYMMEDQVDNLVYSVYDESMQSVGGLTNQDTEFRINPTPGYYANLSLPSGTYYLSSVATKGSEYGGKMGRVVVPRTDVLSLGPCKSMYLFGESISIEGSSTDDTIKVKVLFPNGSIAKQSTLPVINEKFSYSFTPDLLWPEGAYNMTFNGESVSRNKQIGIKRLVSAVPVSVKRNVNISSPFSEKIGIKNTGTSNVSITLSTTGDLEDSYITVTKTKIEADKSAAIDIVIDSVDSSIAGSIIIEGGNATTVIPVDISIIGDSETTDCPECPECPDNPECPTSSSSSFTVTPSVWSRNYMVNEKAKISITITNDGNESLDSFLFDFIPDLSTDQQDMPYRETSPSIDSLIVSAGDSETVDFSFIPEYTGTFSGKLEVSNTKGSAYILVNLNIYENISESIEIERLNIEDYADEISYDLYSELERFVSSAESDMIVGNYENAIIELEKARAVRSIISDYSDSFSGENNYNEPDQGSSGGSTSGDAGSGFDIIIIIIVIIIVALGGVGAFIYMKNKKAAGLSENDVDDGFSDDEFGDY